jgi:tetratricopeptide (TPR) repeat protein
LAGRQQELAELGIFLDSACKSKGSTVLISGEAGSGKTRLISEFLNIMKKNEVKILTGWCLSNASLPYFPFIEAFSSDLPSEKENRSFLSRQSGVQSWLSESYQHERLQKNIGVDPHVWKDQAFAAVTKELLFMSSVKPLIIVLEDIHWADSASLALLHYISRAIVTEKVLILATFRSEELDSDATGKPHQLVETIHLMGREGLFKKIKLTNLDQDNVRKIAESMLSGEVNDELVEKLSRESRGNPLFIVEFLRLLFEKGKLIRNQDQWQLSSDKLGLPSKVREIIMRRISALRPDQRRILDVASVIGEKFDPDLIAGVLSKDRLEILEVLNGILQSTSLVTIEENSYRFDHSKSQEILYDELSLPLKRGYHERIAQQIEIARLNGEEISQSDLAFHYARAGNKEKSVKYGLAAGQGALEKFSNTEAIRHFTYVIEIIANFQKCNSLRSVALEGLGDAYYANCMFEEAIKCFDSLANSEAGVVKLRAYRKEMDAVWHRDNDATRLMQLVKEAENYVASDSLERGRILWNRGRGLLRLGDLKAALKDHEKALRIFEEEYSLPDAAQLLAGTGVTRIMCGTDPKKGLSELQRSVSIYRELGDFRGEIMATILRNTGFIFCGLGRELDGAYANVLRMGEKIGDFENLVTACLYTALLLEVVPPSRFKEAIAQNLKALEYSRKTDSKGIQTRIYAGLTREYARIGDLENADYYFDMLMKLPPEILSRQRNYYFVLLTEAVLFAAKGKRKEANQRFGRVFELLKIGFYHHINFEILYKSNYAWALDMQGRTEEAKVQRAENYKTLAKIEERFGHADLQASLMMRRKVVVGEKFEMRLEMVNVSRRSCSIVKVEAVVPSEGFEVTDLPSYCCLQNGDIELEKRTIGAFEVQTIKLGFKATKAGVLNLNPEILYVDDLGKTKTCKPNSIRINVKPALSSLKEKEFAETLPVKLEFRSEAAQKAFDFLINAFVEDYFRCKLPKERSGWRTLMEIVKQAKVSQYSMYGSGGGRGLAATELERLGVVEVRVFFGERGRGGKVLKFRVSSEKENVKHFIDQRI